MKPHVICHMASPLDGRLRVSQWSKPEGGSTDDQTKAYEELHDRLDADGWLCGRVTMGEFAKGEPHPPADPGRPERPLHVARRDADGYAVALDRHGKLHWTKAEANGDHLVMLLGRDVPDAHLAELAADGISYVVSDDPDVDLGAMLETLHSAFGIETLLLEGGGGIVGSMLGAGLVDEFSLVLFPALYGKSGARSIVEADEGLGDGLTVSLSSFEALDQGVMWLRYAIRYTD